MEISKTYFNTIHQWMPIISKKRIDLGIPFRDSGPDLAVLFLAMKLVYTPPELAKSLYGATREFLQNLEADKVVSLRCLQAMILVALYEYSHSIYPAAWMTVGACSRYADIIGLSPSGQCSSIMGIVCSSIVALTVSKSCIVPCLLTMFFLGQTTWTGVEERRRTWWAIFILDRVISLGSRRRFSCPDPKETDVLPANDSAWVKSPGNDPA
jgi:hypothetical protein